MNSLAEIFLGLLESLDAPTIRDLFISLGIAGSGFDVIITFNDYSQAKSDWICFDDGINNRLMFRESPGQPWKPAV